MVARKQSASILTVAAMAAVSLALTASPADAVDLYWDGAGGAADGASQGGNGTWDLATTNWDDGASHVVWPDTTADKAFFAGSAGTVTLGSGITLGEIDVSTVNNYFIGGAAETNSLNFGGANAILVDKVDATIRAGIAGSPDIQHINRGFTNNGFLTLAPTSSVTMAIDRIDAATNPANARNSTLNLGGDGDGSASAIKWEDGKAQQLFVNKIGSGTWTVGDVTFYNRSGAGAGGEGRVTVTSGDLIANGTIRASHDVHVNGGVLHYNNPGAVNSTLARSGGELSLNGGSLDNSSGAAITTSTFNPGVVLTGAGFTFIGSDDLNLGTGPVFLTGSPTATIDAATLTLGGAISHAGASTFGLTKAGPGTLDLTGTLGYTGDTTVSAGTLSIGDGATTTTLSDSANVSVGAGSTLNLNYPGTDTVFALNLAGSLVSGEWGALGSGAANESGLLTGTGFLNSTGGLAPPGTFFWDGPNSGGTGDGASDGGSGTWSTSNDNWDVGFAPREVWTDDTANKAIFGTTAGTVTLGSDITLGELVIEGASTYAIGNVGEDNTLNFGGANLITVDMQSATLRAGISGSPTVDSQGRVDHSSTLLLVPGAAVTQELGTVNVIRSDPARNSRLDLDGDSAGNSIDAITWTNGGQQLTVTKKGSGTWTVGGGYDNGPNGDSRWVVDEGTLILDGTFNPSHQFDIQAGGILGGDATVSVARGGATEVPRIMAGGAIAPGAGIGTLTVADTQLIWNSDDATAGMLFDLSTVDNSSDLLDISGAFTRGTGSSFLFDFTGGTSGQTYTLATFASSDFALVDFGIASGIGGTFALTGTSLEFSTTATVIPEPATFTLSALGLVMLSLVGRRRRRR